MDAATSAGAPIPIGSVPNMRDLGGWPVGGGGTTKFGLVYRSTELHDLDRGGAKALARLGIRTVYDLRTAAERDAKPDRDMDSVEDVHLDVLADLPGAAPAEVLSVLEHPHVAEQILGDGKAQQMFLGAYRALITLPSANASYRRLYADLARPDIGPVLFHCTTGKDRTGWAAAALLLLLGVSEDDVMRDYLLTNDQLLPKLEPMFDRFTSLGGDPDLLRPVLGVASEYLEASLDEMRSRHGTIEAYFADALGLDQSIQEFLRTRLIT